MYLVHIQRLGVIKRAIEHQSLVLGERRDLFRLVEKRQAIDQHPFQRSAFRDQFIPDVYGHFVGILAFDSVETIVFPTDDARARRSTDECGITVVPRAGTAR